MPVAMKRTTVFASEDDLAVLKAAAARRGVPEAELIRDAIHLAAMANRTWREPFFRHVHNPGESSVHARADEILGEAWAEKADAYERTKSRPR